MAQNTQRVKAFPTLDTSAYEDGDVMGGVMTFSGLNPGGGVIHTITIFDRDAEGLALDLYFFTQTPPDSITDQAAFAMSSDNQALWLGKVTISAADWTDVGSDSEATLRNVGLAIPATGQPDGNLFVVMVARGAQNFAAATDVELGLTILPG